METLTEVPSSEHLQYVYSHAGIDKARRIGTRSREATSKL